MPWSEGLQNDDRMAHSLDSFFGKQVVVSEKLDGESCSMYSDHIHARSLDSAHHPSRTMVKQLHGRIAHNIPLNYRICGENVYAKHSIFYDKLTDYFYAFSIWNEANICLSWEDTLEWAKLLDIKTVPVLYQGIWDEKLIKECWTGKSVFGDEQEGYVVRLVDSFHYDDFSTSLVKYVRKNHVQTNEHWLNSPIIPNLLQVQTYI